MNPQLDTPRETTPPLPKQKETLNVKDMLYQAKKDGKITAKELIGISNKFDATDKSNEIDKDTVKEETKKEVEKLSNDMLSNGVTLKNKSEVITVLETLIKLSFGSDIPKSLATELKSLKTGDLSRELEKALAAQKKSHDIKLKEFDSKKGEVNSAQTALDDLKKSADNGSKMQEKLTKILENKLVLLKEDGVRIFKDLKKLDRGITVSIGENQSSNDNSSPNVVSYRINIHSGGIFDGNIQDNDDKIITDPKLDKEADSKAKAEADAEAKNAISGKVDDKKEVVGADLKAKEKKLINQGVDQKAVDQIKDGKPISMEKLGEIFQNLSKNPIFGKLFSLILDFIKAFNPEFGNTEVGKVAEDENAVQKEGKFDSSKQEHSFKYLSKIPKTDEEINKSTKEGTKEKIDAENETKTLIRGQTNHVNTTLNLIKASEKNVSAKFVIAGNQVMDGEKVIMDKKVLAEVRRILEYKKSDGGEGINSENIDKEIIKKLKQEKPAEPVKQTEYTIKSGDTLGAIAHSHGIKGWVNISKFVEAVNGANPGLNKDKLKIGSQITIPTNHQVAFAPKTSAKV